MSISLIHASIQLCNCVTLQKEVTSFCDTFLKSKCVSVIYSYFQHILDEVMDRMSFYPKIECKHIGRNVCRRIRCSHFSQKSSLKFPRVFLQSPAPTLPCRQNPWNVNLRHWWKEVSITGQHYLHQQTGKLLSYLQTGIQSSKDMNT